VFDDGGYRAMVDSHGLAFILVCSRRRFAAAPSAGKFEREIVAVEFASKKGPTVFARDEHPRPDTTLATLAKLRPAFRKDGTITAGNSPGLNSGAAAVTRSSERDWPAASIRELCGYRAGKDNQRGGTSNTKQVVVPWA
jgi:acetyl-CoA acetyltransferase